MLYHLLAPLARQHIFFNLFNYITFRAAGATVTALLLAFIEIPDFLTPFRSIATSVKMLAGKPPDVPPLVPSMPDGSHPEESDRA